MPAFIKLEMYDNSDFDHGAPRWKRGLWVFVRFIFFQNPYPWGSAFRSALLRAFGAKVGKGVWIGDDVGISSLAQVTIESKVCVARPSFLCAGSHDFRREDFKRKVAPILLRTGSWIAMGSLILPGVTIGEGAVVSAGSVVLKDVPANCLVRGNPAAIMYEIFRGPGCAKASVAVSRVL